jgi:hypothetical protein
MAVAEETKWHIKGEELGHCNCDWGCPCQFNSVPTHGHCEAVAAYEIREGSFGSVDLRGARWVNVFTWPGAVHEGNGTKQMILSDQLSPEQREALEKMESGQVGGAYFEIFTAVCPNRLDPVVASMEFTIDREARRGTIRVAGIVESEAAPITNPVTGEEHRVRIDLPNGFEYKQAEVGNTVFARVHKASGFDLEVNLERSYAQLNPFDWSNA